MTTCSAAASNATPARLRRAAFAVGVGFVGLIVAEAGAAMPSAFAPRALGQPLPWEVWRDLRMVAQVPVGDQVLLRSSHCPSGCRFDRHSEGDSRFLRVDGDEGVIFEETGPGAIVRIWMTTGAGVSQPLDPAVRVRFYFDDEETPRLDLPLPALFDGSTPPFVPPLVLDRASSSGGFVSYVPIPFATHCRVALVGAESVRLWFQLGYHRLRAGAAVTSFRGDEDLSDWAALLASAGTDPWPPGGSVHSSSVELEPGSEAVVFAGSGTGLIEAVRITAPVERWTELWLRMTFDGETTVDLALSDVFGVGRDPATATRSLLVGVDASGRLYSYFPLPYERSAELSLRLSAAASGSVSVDAMVRRGPQPPLPNSGRFTATFIETPVSTTGVDVPVLAQHGTGKWVGLIAEIGSIGTLSRGYLEGDERVYVDGSAHPMLYGTGVEDFFGGGFYFDQGRFRQALHGMIYQGAIAPQTDVTSAYRLLLTDAVPYQAGLRVGIEAGPENQTPIRARSVAFGYRTSRPPIAPVDLLDLGDPDSVQAHGYDPGGPAEQRLLASTFEGDPPVAVVGTVVYRPPSTATFTLSAVGCRNRLRLRRRFDAGLADQQLTVRRGATALGSLPYGDANPFHRWREADLDLPLAAPLPPRLELAVEAGPFDASGEHSEASYELWCGGPEALFADGFESGRADAWSASVGATVGRATR